MVRVPEINFVMVDGDAAPDSGGHRQAIRWLFSVIAPLKRLAKERMGKDFVEPPLEGLWWSDDSDGCLDGLAEGLHWRMMIE